jgi:hypothetical protein
MISRIAGVLVLTATITFGFLGIAPVHATSSTTSTIIKPSTKVPELNPMGLASGVALLVGGVLLLNERRRKKE